MGLIYCKAIFDTWQIWSLASKQVVMQFEVSKATALSACRAVAISNGTDLLLFYFKSFNISGSPHIHLTDGARCAGGYHDGTLRVFDMSTVDMRIKMSPHDGAVFALAFSVDGLLNYLHLCHF